MNLDRFLDYLSELDEAWIINDLGEIRSLDSDKCPLVAASKRSRLCNNDYLTAAESFNMDCYDATDIVAAADFSSDRNESFREKLLIACRLASPAGKIGDK